METDVTAERVTLAGVAEEAGVSLSTISKVLNGRADVSAATRARVEALLAERGYQRRVAAAPSPRPSSSSSSSTSSTRSGRWSSSTASSRSRRRTDSASCSR